MTVEVVPLEQGQQLVVRREGGEATRWGNREERGHTGATREGQNFHDNITDIEMDVVHHEVHCISPDTTCF